MLDRLFALDPTPRQLDLPAAWRRIQSMPGTAFEAAACAAVGCDRLAWVFAAGYHGALQQAFGVASERKTALCVTEDVGNSPKAIDCRWEGGRLFGHKSFVTMGEQAEDLLVLASRGEDDGKKDLVLVTATTSAPGVSFGSVSIPLVPEVPHARVSFDATPAKLVDEDAWPAVKRFRFVEDVFVLGTTIAWFLGLSRSTGKIDDTAELSALLLATRAINDLDPTSAEAHLAYDGTATAARRMFDAFNWSELPGGTSELWARDRALLQVAHTARQIRTERARTALGLDIVR